MQVHARDVRGDLPGEARPQAGPAAAGAGTRGAPGAQARGIFAGRLPVECRGGHLLPGGEHAPRYDSDELAPAGRAGRRDRVSRAVRAHLPAGGEPGERARGNNQLGTQARSEEHTSELQSPCNLVCRLLLEKKKRNDLTSEKRGEAADVAYVAHMTR